MKAKERAAAPAFQFYPSDWMSGAPARMAPDETHVYIWLLCLDWESTGFEFNQKELAHFCRLPARRFAKAWERVSKSFVERDGRYYNPRLEKERRTQAIWREKSRLGGIASGYRRRKGGSTKDEPPIGRVVQPPYEPNANQRRKGGSGVVEPNANQKPTLLSSSKELRSNSNLSELGAKVEPPLAVPNGRAGAEGARTREQDELDDINRRRMARGEAPVDAL